MPNLSFLSKTQQILCRLLAESLFNIPFSLEEGMDWRAVFHEGKEQTVVIPAFLNYEKLPFDSELKEEIQKAVNQCSFQSIQNYTYHDYLNCLMTENGISYCVLKGAASAEYYPSVLMRQMGDVDFLVEKEDFDRVAKILREDGFSSSGENHVHHVVFQKGHMDFEMHFDPPGLPIGPMEKTVRQYFSDILDKSQKMSNDFATCMIPGALHHGLIMLLHMKGHLFSEGIGLRHLCDWAVFANALSDREFREMFQMRLKEIGLWKFAQTITLASHFALGISWKPWMGKDQKLAKALLLDIFTGGNFGVKSKQRSYEGFFISNRGKNGIRHTTLVQAFLSVNEVVYGHWPIAKKLKILLPFGWCFFTLRWIVRMILGKRKRVNLLSVYENGSQRRKLYRQLKLFVKEK